MLHDTGSASYQQNLFSMISSGGYASIFAMGIGPYITASIVIQLLVVAIPSLEQISKDGEDGRKKIGQYTRVVAILLSIMQGIGYIHSLKNLFVYRNMFVYTAALLSLVAGSIFVMWLGESIGEFGVGNGSSFIIFANILSGLPNAIQTIYLYAVGGDIYVWIKIAVLIILFILLMCFSIYLQYGERRIPIQYSSKISTHKSWGAQNSYMPIKVNIAGVMSIIFAVSLLQFPATLYQVWKISGLKRVVDFLSIVNPWGTLIYVFLIFCFTFFYTSFAINTVEISENLKKSGGFIPGVRPGKPTSDYILSVVDRLSWVGAMFYSLIAIAPVILQWIFKFNIGFGGTTLLIVTGVALDIIKQLESQFLVKSYKSFMN
jgi:preprotein translocase subunit SecY